MQFPVFWRGCISKYKQRPPFIDGRCFGIPAKRARPRTFSHSLRYTESHSNSHGKKQSTTLKSAAKADTSWIKIYFGLSGYTTMLAGCQHVSILKHSAGQGTQTTQFFTNIRVILKQRKMPRRQQHPPIDFLPKRYQRSQFFTGEASETISFGYDSHGMPGGQYWDTVFPLTIPQA